MHASVLDPKSIWGKLGVTSAQRWLLNIPSSECKGVAFSRIGTKVSGFLKCLYNVYVVVNTACSEISSEYNVFMYKPETLHYSHV